jgi:hypothetical protein
MAKLKESIAISDKGFVFNPETGESFAINPIGQVIFAMIRDGKNYDEIQARIIKGYHVDDATFEKDYQDFINLLRHYLLLEEDEQEEV